MRKRRTRIVLAGAVMLLLIVLGMYAGIGFYYRTHFLEHATINGTDVSDLTAEEAKERLAASVENYTLTVKTREGKTETIRGEDIRYRLVADQEIQSFLDQQNAMAWLPKYFGSGDAYTMEVSTSYDKALLQHVEARLDCLKNRRDDRSKGCTSCITGRAVCHHPGGRGKYSGYPEGGQSTAGGC